MIEESNAKEKTLYERLGGYDVIASFVTDYIGFMRADPQFDKYASSRGKDKRMRDLQLTIDYVCKITGGRNYYMGRDMKTTHAGLGITASEWDQNMQYLERALDKNNIPKKEKEEVIRLVADIRPAVVEN